MKKQETHIAYCDGYTKGQDDEREKVAVLLEYILSNNITHYETHDKYNYDEMYSELLKLLKYLTDYND
jgi:hypothetical protein